MRNAISRDGIEDAADIDIRVSAANYMNGVLEVLLESAESEYVACHFHLFY